MQFRRNGLRDERRRRALMDDRAADSGKQAASGEDLVGGRCSTRTYSKSAVDERRIRVVDVVPIYATHVALFYVVALGVIAGLLALDYYAAHRVRWADLARVDSLGTYLTAGSLLAGALLACLIYRIRRHRIDDYRGRYRCWLWFAGLLLLASLDSMLNFRKDVAIGLESASKLRFFGQTGGWWAVVWCFGYGAMALRAAIEVRESYATLIVGALSGVLLLGGVALELELLLPPANLPADLILHAIRLLGCGLLLAGLVQYARYVWLDAQGLIAHTNGASAIVEEEAEAKPAAKPRRSRAAAKKEVAESAEQDSDTEEEAPASRGWFSFGRKKVAVDEAQEETPPPASTKKKAARVTEEEEAAEPKPKRAWFSLGRKQAAEDSSEETAKPAPTKARSTTTQPEPEEAEQKPKRSWFSFGRKVKEDEPVEAEAKPAKPAAKSRVAPETPPETEASDEKPKKKSWFSWGSKSEAADEPEQDETAEESRTTMSPRITTRPKASSPPKAESPKAEPAKPQPPKSQPPKPQPARPEPPTITGKYSEVDEDEESGNEDEEILRLEAKPDHLLSKAERRRLKKLKRRSAA